MDQNLKNTVQTAQDLQQQWDLLNQKLAKLKQRHAIETRVEEKLRLEHLIAEDSDALQSIDTELNTLKKQISTHPDYSSTLRRATLPDNRYDLKIQLDINNDKLIRHFYIDSERICSDDEYWPTLKQRLSDTNPSVFTEALFETLFGLSASQQISFVRALIDNPLSTDMPLRYPARARISSNDEFLLGLAWSQATYIGQNIKQSGWSFELSSLPAKQTLNQSNVRLTAPCQALIIIPTQTQFDSRQIDAHRHSLQQQLEQAGSLAPGYIHSACDWSEVQRCIAQYKPQTVYFYGVAEIQADRLLLNFNDNCEQYSAAKLAELWREHPPRLLFFNLIQPQQQCLGSQLAPLASSIPLLISQTTTLKESLVATRKALSWLHALLSKTGAIDPARLLHEHGLETAAIWGHYEHCQIQIDSKPPQERLAHLTLDRKLQRRVGSGAVKELIDSREQRLSCLLACGESGNLVELYTQQLQFYLEQHEQESFYVVSRKLRLPPRKRTFNCDDIDYQVRLDLGLGSQDALSDGLEVFQNEAIGNKRPLLLLEWEIRGTREDHRLTSKGLQAWIEYCREPLSQICPAHLRILSCLTLESEQTKAIENIIEQLRGQLQNDRFRLEHMIALSDVSEEDLKEFLNQEQSSCPAKLRAKLAKLIYNKTEGNFKQTVELIEKLEKSGWFELYYQLEQESGSADNGINDETPMNGLDDDIEL